MSLYEYTYIARQDIQPQQVDAITTEFVQNHLLIMVVKLPRQSLGVFALLLTELKNTKKVTMFI